MQTTPKWEIFELTLHCADTFENPFLDVELSAVFNNGVDTYVIDGFFDGDDIWRLRFAPMGEGVWRYETRANIAALDGKKGEFLCTAPVSRGGLTVNAHYPNWFFREDKRPQWVINDGWFPHPLFDMQLPHESLHFPKPTEEDMRLLIDCLSENGVNMLVETDQLYARQSCLEDDSFDWPWAVIDAKTNRIDRDRFNLKYYQRLERTVEYAKERDVFFGYEMSFDNSTFRPHEWSTHPWNRRNGGWLDGKDGIGWPDLYRLDDPEHVKYVSRYMRYTIARLAPYRNIFWEMGTETGNLAKVPGKSIPVERIAAWYEYMGDFVARYDIYGRLTSLGDTGEQTELIYHRRNVLCITQEHTSMDDLKDFTRAINAFGERFWAYGHPTIICEQDRHNVNKYVAERRGYWVAFVSGFYMGRVDRHFAIAENGALKEGRLFCDGAVPPIYESLKQMAAFVEESGVAYWRMSPADQWLLSVEGLVYCLAAPGEEYLVYFVDGGAASIRTPAIQATWYNVQTGTFLQNTRHPAGVNRFATPGPGDWALHIRSEAIQTRL